MSTTTNIKQLSWIPQKGEHRISVNIAKVANLRQVWDFAEGIGFQPELIAIQRRERIEIHLLLLQEQLEPGTVLGFEQLSLFDRLSEVIPDNAIWHVYGGEMAVEVA
jgi:hypothetical protein